MNNDEYYQQEKDLALIVELAPHLQSRSFLDVGAEKGSFAGALAEIGLAGACFEPLPSHFEALGKRFEGTSVQVFPFAVDETDREASFFIATDEVGKQLDYYHSLNPIQKHDYFEHSKEIKVRCRSLESLLGEGAIAGECGILKIDTEGNDLRVLRGLGALRPEVIVCEFVPPEVYPKWELAFARNLVPFAESLGYRHCLAISRFHRTGQEALKLDSPDFAEDEWGNLVFFRDDFFAATETKLRERVAAAEPEPPAAQPTEPEPASESCFQKLLRFLKLR